MATVNNVQWHLSALVPAPFLHALLRTTTVRPFWVAFFWRLGMWSVLIGRALYECGLTWFNDMPHRSSPFHLSFFHIADRGVDKVFIMQSSGLSLSVFPPFNCVDTFSSIHRADQKDRCPPNVTFHNIRLCVQGWCCLTTCYFWSSPDGLLVIRINQWLHLLVAEIPRDCIKCRCLFTLAVVKQIIFACHDSECLPLAKWNAFFLMSFCASINLGWKGFLGQRDTSSIMVHRS